MVRERSRNKEKRPVVVPPQPKGQSVASKRSVVAAQTSNHRLTIDPNNSPARSYQQTTLVPLRTSRSGVPSSDIPSALEHQSCSTPARALVESSSKMDSDNSGSSNDASVEFSTDEDIDVDVRVEGEDDGSLSVGKKRARGYAKPKVQRVEGDKKPIAFIYDGKILGDGVATWFTPVMRNDMHGFFGWIYEMPEPMPIPPTVDLDDPRVLVDDGVFNYINSPSAPYRRRCPRDDDEYENDNSYESDFIDNEIDEDGDGNNEDDEEDYDDCEESE